MNLEPTWDPLGYQTDLPLRERFYPLGFAFDIETNSNAVLAAAGESWPSGEPVFPDAPLRFRVLVAPPGRGGTTPIAPSFHGQGHLLTLVADSSRLAACDLAAGFAFAVFPEEALRDLRHFRFFYLECVAYAMLTYQRLTAIHASCVSWGKDGILLCGRPGAGKSCLAFACALQGFAFVGDDAVYLLREERSRTVLGMPRYVRLKRAARDLFPEIQARPVGIDVNGEHVIELATSDLSHVKTRRRCRIAHVVFLKRHREETSGLAKVSAGEAAKRLVAELPRFSDEVTLKQVDSVQQLVEDGAYQLVYSDLESAVGQLRKLVGGKGV